MAICLLAAGALAAGCGGNGGDQLSSGDLRRAPARLHVASPAFINGSRLLQRYTCDGADDEPTVQAGTVPPSTSELVLIVSDRDAPGGTYVHVTRFGISPRGDGSVDHGGREGRNSRRQDRSDRRAPAGRATPRAAMCGRSMHCHEDSSGIEAGAQLCEVAAALGDSVLATDANHCALRALTRPRGVRCDESRRERASRRSARAPARR